MRKSGKILAMLLTLAMALSLVSMSAFASATVPSYEGVQMQFGDPDYDPTRPESAMAISGANSAYTADYTGADAAYFYPSELSLYVKGETGDVTLVGSGVKFATYVDTVETLHDTITRSENQYPDAGGVMGPSDLFTLKIQSAGTVTITGGAQPITLAFSAPKSDFPSTPGATPNAFMAYLPIGQYANGAAWGSPFSDGTVLTGKTPKIVGAYSGTGVSLGAAGGYVQYDFGQLIADSASNPFGVDFIVYGNAFNGNPEAASVKVSDDGDNWYELAGSLYYDNAVTKRNATVSYQKRSDGIYYTLDGSTWTKFTASTAWWPEYTDEGYGAVYGGNQNGVLWSTDRNTITFSGVTLVRDTDTTNDYQFGYADVHVNGTSYGTAVNPYTITNTASGGDGFDIAWAVKSDGAPANLSSIRYVRVYTSAAMKSDGSGVFTTPSIFGETSAEVCGIYAAAGSTTEVAVAPTVTVAGNVKATTNGGMTTVRTSGTSPCTVNVSGAGNVFINGVATTSALVTPTGTGTKVQIIVQNGEAAPYITWLNLR